MASIGFGPPSDRVTISNDNHWLSIVREIPPDRDQISIPASCIHDLINALVVLSGYIPTVESTQQWLRGDDE